MSEEKHEINNESDNTDGIRKRNRRTIKETVTTEMLLNRQINYSIIRNLWLVIKGEVASPDESRNLYTFLGMSKTRYDRICGGIRANVSKELLDKVKREMQIDEGVFSGTIRLSLKIKSKNDNKNTIGENIDKYLEEYVNHKKELRIARENNNQAEIDGEKSLIEIDAKKEKRVKEIHNMLKKYLKHYVKINSAIDAFADENFRKLAYYIREGVIYSNSISEQVERITKMMDRISFRGLDDVRMNTLENYFKVLQKQYERTRIILEYKREKSK